MINIQKIQYLIFGYVRIKNTIDSQSVSSVRERLDKLTFNREKFIYANEFYKKELYKFLLDPKLIEAYKTLFGNNFKLSTGGVLHHENYGVHKVNGKVYPGVHIDSDFQYFRNESKISEFNYKFAKIGIYLQSSSEKINILAIPGTHLIARFLAKLKLRKFVLVILWVSKKILSIRYIQTIFRPKLVSGDALIFDCLMVHASDIGKSDLSTRKYVIYSEVGDENSISNFMYSTVVNRAKNELIENSGDQIFDRDPLRYNMQINLSNSEIDQYVDESSIGYFFKMKKFE